MWLQSFTRLIKQARRWARVNGIFSRKRLPWFYDLTQCPCPQSDLWSRRLIENIVYITKASPGKSNKTIAFYYMAKNQWSHITFGWTFKRFPPEHLLTYLDYVLLGSNVFSESQRYWRCDSLVKSGVCKYSTNTILMYIMNTFSVFLILKQLIIKPNICLSSK